MFYPALAIGGTILTIAAAARDGRLKPAATLAAAGLLMTIKAGPNMLAVRHVDNDATALQKGMDDFVFWSRIRGALQIGAFIAVVAALSDSY